jgi:hypothetical protein
MDSPASQDPESGNHPDVVARIIALRARWPTTAPAAREAALAEFLATLPPPTAPGSELSSSLVGVLADWLDSLEERITRLGNAEGALDVERECRREELGDELAALRAFAGALEGEPPPAPAAHLTADLDRISRLDRETALPPRTDASDTIAADATPGFDTAGGRARLLHRLRHLRLLALTESVSGPTGVSSSANPDAESASRYAPGGAPVTNDREWWSRRLTLTALGTEIAVAAGLDAGAAMNGAEDLAAPERSPPNESGTLSENERDLARIHRARRRMAESFAETLTASAPGTRATLLESALLASRTESDEGFARAHEVPPRAAAVISEGLAQDARELARLAAKARENSPESARAIPDRGIRRLLQATLNERQDRRLAARIEGLLGSVGAARLENGLLVLVVLMCGLIGAEFAAEWFGWMSPAAQDIFAIADLFICVPFLLEFAFKLALADDRWRFFRRNWLIGLVAAIPFGFLVHQLHLLESAGLDATDATLVQLLRLLRLPRMARYLRLARPLLRLARMLLFVLRGMDRFVRRNARLFNRNIILFEPDRPGDRADAPMERIRRLERRLSRRDEELAAILEPADRTTLVRLLLERAERRIDRLQPEDMIEPPRVAGARDVRMEAVISRLTEMTPERFLEEHGEEMAERIRGFIRRLDAPLIRRVPFVRDLVPYFDLGAATVASHACNALGYRLQRLLDVAWFFADLAGTITGPVFLDRVGATIVLATAGPTKRLLSLAATFFILNLIVLAIIPFELVRRIADGMGRNLGGTVLILGAACAIPMVLGMWLRRIANKAAESAERISEAQFAALTRRVKQDRRGTDARFLGQRVIAPELELREFDDAFAVRRRMESDVILASMAGRPLLDPELQSEEHVFLRAVELLYQDYLSGSLFHANDTRTTVQLLGNLAFANLRECAPARRRDEERRLARLDLARFGGVFAGPYLWFRYINRLLTQSTAELLEEYSRRALPSHRLAAADERTRAEYRQWLARRLKTDPESIRLPPPLESREPGIPFGAGPERETVEFTALDFLLADSTRDAEVERRYGPDLAALMQRDRRDNLRAAFRSFPLHDLPARQRTFNPLRLFDRYIAGGRFLLAPIHFLVLGWRIFRFFFDRLIGTIRLLLAGPEAIERSAEVTFDSFEVARRKIFRMRKPLYLHALDFRARIDPEYLGLTLPGLPVTVARDSLMEKDLGYIGASRLERVEAERLRGERAALIHRVHRWLVTLGLDESKLPALVAERFPHLSARWGEAMRAMIVAAVLDHDDVHSLGCAIEGMGELAAWAARPTLRIAELPPGLPPPINPRTPRHHPDPRRIDLARVLDRFVPAGSGAIVRRNLEGLIRRHRRTVDGWIRVLGACGDADPIVTLRRRFEAVIGRTDLWSDMIVSLRTVQTLAVLDVHHYCSMAWKLGGYDSFEADPFRLDLPFDEAPPSPTDDVVRAALARLLSGR